MFKSEAYTLQDNKAIEGEIITDGEIFIKAQYLCSMKESTDLFWDQHTQYQFITVTTLTILHPKLDVTTIIDIHDIPKSVCNGTQAKNTYQDILYVLLI